MIEPPEGCVAVIFTSRRRETDAGGYADMAEAMSALAEQQPGYLGVESVRDPVSRLGITVSYWADDASARAWKDVAAHRVAQQRGRDEWYADYSVVVAQVTRAYVVRPVTVSTPSVE